MLRMINFDHLWNESSASPEDGSSSPDHWATEPRNSYPQGAGLLAHLARLERRGKIIRQLRVEGPHVLGALKPSWAMSPLIVAELPEAPKSPRLEGRSRRIPYRRQSDAAVRP